MRNWSRALSPLQIVSTAALAGVAGAVLCVVAATGQPWLGLRLAPSGSDRAAAPVVVSASGPSAAIPPGAHIEQMVAGAGRALSLRNDDLAPEPDTAFVPYADYAAFFARQETLALMERAGPVELRFADGRRTAVTPEATRPIGDLPWEFWLQVVSGLGCILVGAALVAFRRADRAVRYVALAGVSSAIAAGAAAVYSTRELALPGRSFAELSAANHFGTSMCCASLVSTLWYYPRPLSAFNPAPLVYLFCGSWWLAERLEWLPTAAASTSVLIVAGYFACLAMAGLQWWRVRGDLRARASLQWFLLTLLGGSGMFVFVVLVPAIAGYDAGALQAYAFGLLLVVIIGVALGVARYRLFDLETWWFRAVMLILGAFTFLGFDLLLASVLHLHRGGAMTLSLFLAGWLYFPARQWLSRRLFTRTRQLEVDDVPSLLRDVLTAAEVPPERLLPETLRRLFAPLQVEPLAAGATQVRLVDDGLGLQVPGIAGRPGCELRFANDGRRLFNRRDVSLAQAVQAVLDRFAAFQGGVERGVERERSRVAQDLHDDVGARLLTLLHRSQGEMATGIRDALDSLRVAVYTLGAPPRPLQDLLASLRAEVAERCEAAEVALDWRAAADLPDALLPASGQQDLTRVLREAVSNALRHARPATLAVALSAQGAWLDVSVTNDGAPLAPTQWRPGLGLRGMRNRIQRLGGHFEVEGEAGRVRVRFRFPLAPAGAPPDEGKT